jgi:hypothetical protein
MMGMTMGKVLWAALLAAGLMGCRSGSYLEQRYAPARADLPDRELPNQPRYSPPEQRVERAVNPEPTNQAPAEAPAPVITGTWTFTTPRTLTRTMKKTGELTQYALYAGRPAANDTPIVVITVGPPASPGAAQSTAEADPATYKVSGTRSYVLNGNAAQEWTGTTSTGAAFSELLLKRPGAGESSDVCHVMATARTTEERKTALEVLGSLTWKASENP